MRRRGNTAARGRHALTGTASDRALVGGLLAFCIFATACSSGSPDVGTSLADGGNTDAGEAGSGCLLCSGDAGFDAGLALRVRGTLDQVCGSADGCHGAGAGNLGILIGSEFTNLIGVASSEVPSLKRVAPGDPEHSYVYMKLSCASGIVGACMPLGNPSAATAQLFHDWIAAGAPTQ